MLWLWCDLYLLFPSFYIILFEYNCYAINSIKQIVVLVIIRKYNNKKSYRTSSEETKIHCKENCNVKIKYPFSCHALCKARSLATCITLQLN